MLDNSEPSLRRFLHLVKFFLHLSWLPLADILVPPKCFDEVQAILAEQMPNIPITAMYAFSVHANNLANVRSTVSHHNRLIWNIEELYFKK